MSWGKKLIPIGILFTVSLAVLVGFFVVNNSVEKESYATPSGDNLESESHSFLNWASLSDKERVELLANSSDRIEDTATASRAFKGLKLPKNHLGRKMLGIYIDRGTKDVTILFENGLHISEVKDHLDNIPPDYEKEVEQAKKDKEAGILQSDSLPSIISVNGIKGIGGEPGYNLVHDEKHSRPGVVAWYDDGHFYEVYGVGIPLDDLLKVAESVY